MTPEDQSRTRSTLLRRVATASTDNDAWREFFDQYRPRIYRWCLARGLQDADAEDLTQELLMKIHRQMCKFVYDPTKSFRAWLKTITNRALIDAFKKNQRAQKLLDNAAARRALFDELQPQFDQELIDEAMTRAQRRVEPLTWEAFRLTSLNGLAATEAGKRLGVPESRIRVQRFRVTRIFQEELRKLDGADAD